MDPKKMLAELLTEGKALRAKSKTPEWTPEDGDRAIEIATKVAELNETIARKDAATAALSGLGEPTQDNTDERPTQKGAPAGDSLGDTFVKSEAYQAFKAAHPSGVESTANKETPIRIAAKDRIGSRFAAKLLTTDETGNAAPVRTGEVDDLVYRPERRLLQVVTRGTTQLTAFEYRQIISKTNNSAIVPEATSTTDNAALKPLSTLTTKVADAKAYTYADGMEVTNQELTDDGVIKALINATLAENLEITLEDVLLNGSGEDGEPAGILNTTGVLQQAYATDMPTSIRKAITKLRVISGAPIRGVLLNPEDDEAWDLLKDNEQRYLGAGPFGTGPGTAWGYERIISQAIPKGQAVMGDFKTIHLLQREALSILAFNQHKDYAQRNITYIRAELRALQLIRNAARLCVVELESGN